MSQRAGGRRRPPRPALSLGSDRMSVRELELDLDAFEGPFDLLLTLVLREELALGEVDVAGIVLAFIERLAERGRARPRRLRGVPRARRVAARAEGARPLRRRGRPISRTSSPRRPPRSWRAGSRSTGGSRARPTGLRSGWPANATGSSGSGRLRSLRAGERRLAQQDPEALAAALRVLPPSPPRSRSRISSFVFRPCRSFLIGFAPCSAAAAFRLRSRGGRASRGSSRPLRFSPCSSCARVGEVLPRTGGAVCADQGRARGGRAGEEVEAWSARSA